MGILLFFGFFRCFIEELKLFFFIKRWGNGERVEMIFLLLLGKLNIEWELYVLFFL